MRIRVGLGAYKRSTTGAPEIVCQNRYAEKAPYNLKEQVSLIARPGTVELETFNNPSTITMTIASPAVLTWTAHNLIAGDTFTLSTTGALPTGVAAAITYYVLATGLTANTFRFALTAGGTAIISTGSQSGVHTATVTGAIIRGTYAKEGLFNSDLFVVAGHQLYRYTSDNVTTLITGVVYNNNDGHPYVTWMKGEGYEYMFIADGLLLQYYNGGTHATGTLTVGTSTPPNIAAQVVEIGGVYYTWSATPNSGTQDGTSANPWKALLGANDDESLENLVKVINYAGIPGTDFSDDLPGPNRLYSATHPTATTVVVTSTSVYAAGNAITTTIFSGADLTWGSATLTGGNVHVLAQVEVPDGRVVKSLASLNSYVLASIGGTRRFYFIEPGEVTIDALNFAEKESGPDPIVDMLAVSDRVLIMGTGTSENWYGTGDVDAPFAPTKGYAFERGVIEGTAVVVGDSTVVLVGNDGIVYEVSGAAKPLSDTSMAERIRVQLRREQGLT